MKLDRNENRDGRGKYALIQMRETGLQRGSSTIVNGCYQVPVKAIRFGDESPGEQFFVLKYKDRFTADALYAYREAVLSYANSVNEPQQTELREYAQQVGEEARKAELAGCKIPD